MAKLVMDKEAGVFCVELKGDEDVQDVVDLAHEAGSIAADGTLYVRFTGGKREWLERAEVSRRLQAGRAPAL